MKKLIIIVVTLILIISAFCFVAYKWYENQITKPASEIASSVEVEIEPGESVKSIAVKLQTAGVISSSDLFFIYVKLNDIASKIQAGRFEIPQNLSIVEVTDIIKRASGNDIWITIPEGLRLDEIAEILDNYFLKEENTIFNKEKFLNIIEKPDDYNLSSDVLEFKDEGKSLEGFLFPDTYNVRKDITELELIETFLDTLEEKMSEEEVDISSHPKLSAYEVIVLASIIEREARDSQQRFMISDILQKRLRGELDGIMLLQADATLLYEEKDWKAVVTKELKEKDSLYNTYMHEGLTPTPICNPGIDSIQAVLSPETNEYFFYLHDDEGKIHYAVTSDEHINNQRCYINKNSDYCL